MTNSDIGKSIFKELLGITIADTYTPWQWENYIPYNKERMNCAQHFISVMRAD